MQFLSLAFGFYTLVLLNAAVGAYDADGEDAALVRMREHRSGGNTPTSQIDFFK